MASRVLYEGKNQITCKYNALTHRGVDVVKYKHETTYIIAHTEGIVTSYATGHVNDKKAKGTASYGNYVKIKHPDGYFTLYAHLKSVYVKKGQKVKTGEKIGFMGNTGKSYGSHLHFEVRNKKDKRIDPTKYLDSDLPSVKDTYSVYDNKKNKWLPSVKVGTNDYAGNFGNSISGIKISTREYRVHDKVKNKWLPYVKGDSSYAGNLPNDIDGLQVKGATYRVHIKGKNWLSWVNKVDNTPSGYAGILGEAIDAIQIK